MTYEFDLSPMRALEIFYEGETLGVHESDFAKNEKQRNLKLPSLLKEFLTKYGHLNVNRGANQIWLPDKIDTDTAKVDGKLRDIYIIGGFRGNLVAIPQDSYAEKNPVILFDELPEENDDEITLVFKSSEVTLENHLTSLFTESPSVLDNSEILNTPESIQQFLQTLDEETRQGFQKYLQSDNPPGRCICWNEDERTFVVIVHIPERNVLVKFSPCFAIRELESIFTREFYENSMNCDFAHALKILRKLIDHLECAQGIVPELGEKYKLAGRCCWALKQWRDAENYYMQAERIYKDILSDALEKAESFYTGLGNFYFDREDLSKSEQAYAEVDRLCEFSGKNLARLKGNRLVRQGQILADGKQYERAIELYTQALEIYQSEPKDCKYDIARCQQLRGDARKQLKLKGSATDKQK